MDDSMNGFADRRKSFEAKYHHDEELNFKIHAKCCHLFAIWAVQRMRYDEARAGFYIDEIIVFQIQKSHPKSLIEKVLSDLRKAEIGMSKNRLEKEWQRCWSEAHDYIMEKENL